MAPPPTRIGRVTAHPYLTDGREIQRHARRPGRSAVLSPNSDSNNVNMELLQSHRNLMNQATAI